MTKAYFAMQRRIHVNDFYAEGDLSHRTPRLVDDACPCKHPCERTFVSRSLRSGILEANDLLV